MAQHMKHYMIIICCVTSCTCTGYHLVHISLRWCSEVRLNRFAVILRRYIDVSIVSFGVLIFKMNSSAEYEFKYLLAVYKFS